MMRMHGYCKGICGRSARCQDLAEPHLLLHRRRAAVTSVARRSFAAAQNRLYGGSFRFLPERYGDSEGLGVAGCVGTPGGNALFLRPPIDSGFSRCVP